MPPKVLASLKEIESKVDKAYKDAMAELRVPTCMVQSNIALPIAEGDSDEIETIDLSIEVELEDASSSVAASAKKEVVQRLSAQLFEEMQLVLEKMLDEADDVPRCGHCFVHDKQCLFHDRSADCKSDAELWVAGTTCTDECPTGSKRQLTGKAALPFMIFMAEVRKCQPAMFLHECTHLFNEENLRKALGDLYVLFPCPMSPHDFGVPYTRPRMLTWCFHRDLPLANPPFTVETLKSFNWGTAMEGDVFFSAPKAWVQSYICRRQHKAMGHTGSDVAPNHVRSPALKAASAGMEHLLSGGDFARIRTQEVEELLRRGEDAHDDRIFLADGIAMKGQTASFSKVKKLMPSLMTRSVPWSYRWKRELLPVEGLGVMGIPVFQSWLRDKEQGLYGCPYQHMLTLLNDSDVRRLAGNGMSLQVMGVAFAAGLSSVDIRPNPLAGSPPCPMPEADNGRSCGDEEDTQPL